MNRAETATVILVAVLAGCGGGKSSSSSQGASVAVSLKDAPSDHIASFETDVTSVDLVSDDGLHVALLSGKKRFDLAQLVNVSQLLGVVTVPGRTYTSLAVSFDLSGATIMIQGSSQSATIADTNGNPLTGIVTRSIDMKSRPIVCEPGLTRYIEIDFDLDASCVVDIAANRVTLGPVLKADLEPANPVDTQIGGILASLDPGQGSSGNFTIVLGPPGSLGTGLPEVKVTTSANTQFFVNGKPGNFDALKSIPIGAPIAARGQLSAGRDSLVASRVDTGDPQDVIEGVVVARTTDGTLTVFGRSVVFPADATTIGTFTVAAQNAPCVVITPAIAAGETPPAPSPLGEDAISVGQVVEAHGKLSGASLDASHGIVILPPGPVFGVALGPATNGLLTISVQRIAMLPVDAFDFHVGNAITADPTRFNVATGSLDTSTITSGTPLVAIGVLAPWNATSATPNMTAYGVADRTVVMAVLQCAWPGATKPFASLGPLGFVLDLSGASLGQVDSDDPSPSPLAASDQPRVLPGPDPAHFFIVQNGTLTDHASMTDFANDCAARLTSGRVQAVNAVGAWDSSAKRLTAHQVVVSFE